MPPFALESELAELAEHFEATHEEPLPHCALQLHEVGGVAHAEQEELPLERPLSAPLLSDGSAESTSSCPIARRKTLEEFERRYVERYFRLVKARQSG